MVSLAGLSAALYVKFRCTDDIPSLDEMVTMLREAVDACLESNEYRSDLLGILCATRATRCARHHDIHQLAYTNNEEEATALLSLATELLKQVQQLCQIVR